MKLKDLKRKTALALVWCTVRSGIEQIFSFVIFLVLGRLLTPEDFGVVALAAGVVEIVRLLSWVGLYEGIIRAHELDELTADTAFWTSLTIGLVLAGLVLVLAPPIARLFNQPALTEVIRVMAVIVVVSALGIVHTGRIARDFGHKALAMRALAANLAGGVAAMAVVAAGGGMWALVAQRLAAETIQTVAAWTALPWMPRLRFSITEIRQMSRFGAGITVANLVNGVNMRAQEAVVGMTLPVAAVGALRIASRLAELIQQMVFMPASQVTMVAFSRLQGDNDNLQRGFLQAVRIAGLVAFPCFLGLAAVAPDLVPWMFGRQWEASTPVLQALCLGVAPTTILYFMAPLQVAVGKANGYAGYSILYLVVGVLFTAATAPYGIVAVGLGLTARGWVVLPAALFLLKRAAGLSPLAVLGAFAPTFAIAVIAAIPAYFLSIWLKGTLPPPVLVAIEGSAYLAAYLALLFIMARRLVTDIAASLLPIMPMGWQGRLKRFLPAIP